MQDTIINKVEKVLSEVRIKYGVLERAFTSADFYRICEGENIFLMGRNLNLPKRLVKDIRRIQGCYVRNKEGEKFIFLESFWARKIDLFVAFHELGHHFIGHSVPAYKASAKQIVVRNKVHEAEADAFAELASGGLRREGK